MTISTDDGTGIGASRGRLDGLSALATTGFGQVGEALTDPLRFTGSTLELNVDCGGHGAAPRESRVARACAAKTGPRPMPIMVQKKKLAITSASS